MYTPSRTENTATSMSPESLELYHLFELTVSHYAAVVSGNGGNIWTSTDSGATWTENTASPGKQKAVE